MPPREPASTRPILECITTPIHTERLNGDNYKAFVKRSIEVTHPFAKSLGRMGEASEVIEAIAFLVGIICKFLAGECIAIDGARQNLGAQ